MPSLKLSCNVKACFGTSVWLLSKHYIDVSTYFRTNQTLHDLFVFEHRRMLCNLLHVTLGTARSTVLGACPNVVCGSGTDGMHSGWPVSWLKCQTLLARKISRDGTTAMSNGRRAITGAPKKSSKCKGRDQSVCCTVSKKTETWSAVNLAKTCQGHCLHHSRYRISIVENSGGIFASAHASTRCGEPRMHRGHTS